MICIGISFPRALNIVCMPWHTFGKQPEDGKNDDQDNDRGNNDFSVLCLDEYNSCYSGERMSCVPRIQEVITRGIDGPNRIVSRVMHP